MLSSLFSLLVIGGLVAGAVALSKRAGPAGQAAGLRLILTALFLAATAIVSAVGIAQLLELALESGDRLAGSNASDVARAIALTAVGLPSFAALWRYQSRLTTEAGSASPAWGLYLALATAVFATGTVIGLGAGLIWLFGWESTGAGSLATGIAWGAMWAWHEWHRVSVRPPVRLSDVAPSIGSTIGLITLASGVSAVVIALLEPAYEALTGLEVVDERFGQRIGEGAVWLTLGAGLWWWQWLRDARRRRPSLARSAYLLVPGAAMGAVVGLSALAVAFYTTVEFAVGRGDASAASQFEVVPELLATMAVGFLVWRYHRTVVLEDPTVLDTDLGYSYRYLLGGIGLIAAASGFGVVINGLLAAATPAVAGSRSTDLLVGGISALLVGGPVWWTTWRPRTRPDDEEVGSRARRTYLTVLAGVGGVTALISLILFVYRLLESMLQADPFGTTVDRFRAPFGVLVATGMVAGYHIVTWRTERRRLPEAERVAVRRVTVVTTHPDDGLRGLGKDLGVPVTTLHSGGTGRVVESAELADYLRTLEADEAVVIEEERGYRVIRVTDD